MSERAAAHLYVLELTGDLIKVGVAGTPNMRLIAHARALGKKDVTILRQWVSPKHAEAYPNEDSLIAACERLGGLRWTGREWFTGLRFDDVVAAASHLPSTDRSGDNTVALEEARANLTDVVARVRYTRESVRLTRRGTPQAVLVPVDVGDLIEAVGGADKAGAILRRELGLG